MNDLVRYISVAPENVRGAIEENVGDLSNFIRSRQQSIRFTYADSRIVKSINWLINVQNENGSWANENVACTSLVIIALSNLVRDVEFWEGGDSEQIQEKMRKSNTDAGNFLVEKYRQNEYENAVWDKAVAVRALSKTNYSDSSFIRSRIEELLAIDPDALNAGPHHLAQRALVFAETGVPQADREAAIKSVVDKLKFGDYNYSPYVLSQCLEAIRLSRSEIESDKIVNKLTSFLSSTHLDSANFINICSSLNALYHIRDRLVEENVKNSISSLFGETCFRENGTWYHDEMATAWALIALTRFSREVVIRAPRSEFIYEVRNIEKRILTGSINAIRKDFYKWILTVILILISSSSLTVLITYSYIPENLPFWLQAFLPSLAGTSFVPAIGFIISYYKNIYGSEARN